MKCDTCANYMSCIGRCKFCHYEEKQKSPIVKWCGVAYIVKSFEVLDNGERMITEWERV